MEHLGIAVLNHLPAGSDGRRTTARSKGKVERPFRTVKEAHETLCHFHKPGDEAEANRWFRRYLAQYNGQRRRSEPHSRLEDWLANLRAEIPCCGSSRKRGIRRRFECLLSTNDGVGIDQQLAGDGDQDDFGWLAGGGHARDEGSERFVCPFGA